MLLHTPPLVKLPGTNHHARDIARYRWNHRMRRTKEDAEKTRIAILASAERLFMDRGVAHTSLDQIARDAGVTRGAVYWHFQNKAHLFHEMLNQVRLPPEQLAERLSLGGQSDALQTLFDLCVEIFTSLGDSAQHMRILTILLHRCEFTDELREAEERHYAFVDLFIDLSEQLFASCAARLRPGVTPAHAARTLHSLVVGLMFDWSRRPERYAVNEPVAMLDPLFHGLLCDWRS